MRDVDAEPAVLHAGSIAACTTLPQRQAVATTEAAGSLMKCQGVHSAFLAPGPSPCHPTPTPPPRPSGMKASSVCLIHGAVLT